MTITRLWLHDIARSDWDTNVSGVVSLDLWSVLSESPGTGWSHGTEKGTD